MSYLLLSPISSDFFHQAIMMSGNNLMPSLFQENPKKKAKSLGEKLNIYENSTEELIKKLRSIHFKDILKMEKDIFHQDDPLGLRSFDFVPSVEPENSTEERCLTNTPINLLLEGKFKTVPLMIGNTNREGLFVLRSINLEPDTIDKYNENPDYLVPPSYSIFNDTKKVKEVSDLFKKLYFHGNNLTKYQENEFADYQTDAGFRFPTDRFIKLYATKSAEAIYYYQFSYSGDLNFIKTFMFLRGLFKFID